MNPTTTTAATPWETPAFEEIRMDAEIGAYQGDDGEPDELADDDIE